MPDSEEFKRHRERILQGGNQKYHDKNASEGKLFARQRIELLVDAGSFV